MKAWFFPLLAAFLLSPASAAPVSWGSFRTLLSQERTGRDSYSLKAFSVNGRLNIRQDVTYSLNFQGGQVSIDHRVLKSGCTTGKLKAGSALNFQEARRVAMFIPSRGCSSGSS